MATQPSLPIQVNASSVQSAVSAALRVLTILIAGATTIVHLVLKGDLAGLTAFIAANDGLVFIAAAITAITFVTSIVLTIQKHRKLVVTAAVAPNSVAQVNS